MKFTGVLKVVELLVSVGFAVSATNLPRSCFILTRNTACIRGYAYLCDRWGLYILDVRNLQSPHRVGSWGSNIISVCARNTICCVTLEDPNPPGTLVFRILDITNPALPYPLSSVDSCGGWGIYLEESLAFISGYYTGGHELRILNIADSTRPRPLGGCVTPEDNLGVWASSQLAFVADRFFRGLAVIDMRNLNAPRYDTLLLAAALSEDIAVSGDYLYLANDGFGMKVLKITDPRLPVEVGAIDSGFNMTTYSVADSFAYMV